MAGRSFDRSTLAGRDRGRPPEPGSEGNENRYARARVAAQRWKSKQERQSPERDRASSSGSRDNAALINSERGAQRRSTRFDQADTKRFKTPKASGPDTEE